MKRAKSELNDWSRPEYKRADLGELVRGKYAKRMRELSYPSLEIEQHLRRTAKRCVKEHGIKTFR
jgi:hypothetical protein